MTEQSGAVQLAQRMREVNEEIRASAQRMAVQLQALRPLGPQYYVRSFDIPQGMVLTGQLTNSNTFTITSSAPMGRTSERKQDMAIGEVKQGEVHPTIPVKGAYVRLTEDGTLDRFEEWTAKDKARTRAGKTVKTSEFEVLTPAMYGMAYERACVIPPGSAPGRIMSITSWHSTAALVRWESGSVDEYRANWVAVCAPPLNPAVESDKDKIARLEREKQLIKDSLHQRMVAEGTARNWCTEFDPILDSTGLQPRHKDNVITGTMEFTFALSRDYGKAEDILDQVKASWSSYIPTRELRIVDVRVAEDEAGPILSI